MANLDLTKYGIVGSTVIAHNPSYEYLLRKKQNQVWKVLKLVKLQSLAQ